MIGVTEKNMFCAKRMYVRTRAIIMSTARHGRHQLRHHRRHRRGSTHISAHLARIIGENNNQRLVPLIISASKLKHLRWRIKLLRLMTYLIALGFSCMK